MTTSDTSPRRGRFITLEGGEGVGKSTQKSRLAEALRQIGLTVVETREPGGSPGAEAIRGLLLHAPDDAWEPAAEALLFAAARSDHVARVIRPALERGEWVICDRFVDSSRAYQSAGSGLSDDDLMALHRIGSGGFLPDRTLLLRLDADSTGQRRSERTLEQADRFEDRDQSYHDAVVARFDELATLEPSRIRRVDAAGDVAEVTTRLLDALADLLP